MSKNQLRTARSSGASLGRIMSICVPRERSDPCCCLRSREGKRTRVEEVEVQRRRAERKRLERVRVGRKRIKRGEEEWEGKKRKEGKEVRKEGKKETSKQEQEIDTEASPPLPTTD